MKTNATTYMNCNCQLSAYCVVSHVCDVNDDVFPVVELQLTSSGQAQDGWSSSQAGDSESVRVKSTELLPRCIVSLCVCRWSRLLLPDCGWSNWTCSGNKTAAASSPALDYLHASGFSKSRTLAMVGERLWHSVWQLTTRHPAVAANDVDGAECIANFSISSSSTQSLRRDCCAALHSGAIPTVVDPSPS